MRYSCWALWAAMGCLAVAAVAADSWLSLPLMIGAGIGFVVLSDRGDYSRE